MERRRNSVDCEKKGSGKSGGTSRDDTDVNGIQGIYYDVGRKAEKKDRGEKHVIGGAGEKGKG